MKNKIEKEACGNKLPRKLAQKRAVNLRKNGTVRFQIGLMLSMALVYLGLNFYAPLLQAKESYAVHLEEDLTLVEELPEVYKVAPKAKPELPKTTNPYEFEVVPDDQLIEKVTQEVIDLDPEPATVPVTIDDLEEYVDPDDIELPMIAIEEVPLFPGCTQSTREEALKCFQEMMNKHIKRHFNYPEFELEMGQQGKVFVLFKIGTDGLVKDIRLKGTNKNFEKEAKRIIDRLPKFTPGKQNGKPVTVTYGIPIKFKLG